MRTTAAAGVLVLTALAWYITTFVRYPSGFTARYYAGAIWTVPPVLTTIEERVSSGSVRRTWTRTGEPVGVRWEGHLLRARACECRFSVLSTGSTRLVVDDRIAIDGDVPWRRQVTMPVALGRGVHRIVVEYTSRAGAPDIQLLWASDGTHPLAPLAGRFVSPRPPSRGQIVAVAAVDATRGLIVLLWTAAWLYWLIRGVVAPLVRRLLRHHLSDGVPATAIGLLAALAALYAVGILWGVPGPGWAPHEILPADLGTALDHGFAHGWWSPYPPAHFYLCSIATAPLLVWRWLDPLAYLTSLGPDVELVMFRLVTVAMALGTVLMVFVCGTYLYGQWPALVAAALAGLTMPAVYYGKMANVDVPYVFWFSVSLASLVRIVVRPATRDYVIVAVTAALAVATKDQAYGLYVFPAIGLLFVRPLRWRLLAGAFVVAAATFAVCDNLLFNWSGFMAHVKHITSPGAAEQFRMFDAAGAGQWQLWRAVWLLVRLSMGWPAFILCVAGLAWSVWRPGREQRRLWWLLLPALSYHVAFLAVVGYAYDRFLLPVFAMIALAGGFCAAQLDRVQALRRPARAIIAATLLYSFVYAAAIDVALLRDPRYAVEAWMHAHVEPGATIGLVGPVEHLPRIDGWYTESVDPTVDRIQALGFEYLVVNADWAERYGPERAEGQGYRALRDGRLKYRPAFEAHDEIRFAGMSLDARLAATRPSGYTALTKLNPPTIVFRRELNPGTLVPTARTP